VKPNVDKIINESSQHINEICSVADPGTGSVTFLTPGSGMEKYPKPRSGIWLDPGSGLIRDKKNRIRDPKSGINIPDPQQ
jgi:hypothetical protein